MSYGKTILNEDDVMDGVASMMKLKSKQHFQMELN